MLKRPILKYYYICSTMTDKEKILFIMNPVSGTLEKTGVAKIVESTIDKEFYDFEIRQTRYSGHAYEMARNARECEYFAVVAVGGDGTVNEVAKALTHSNTALGIIPCGSGNGLARHLMLPMDVRRSVETINAHTVHTLDYGVINDTPFFCTCGMGFDAFISMKFAEAGRRGPITYLENILREGLRYKPETYEIIYDGHTHVHRAFLISCANASQYGNNAYIAPQASMSDGLLDVTIMQPFDMIEAPQLGIDLFNKTIDKNPRIQTFKTRHIHIKRDKPGFIHYDGDPIMTSADVDIRIEPRGINIIVNPLAHKERRQPSAMQTAYSVFVNDILATLAGKHKLKTQAGKMFSRNKKDQTDK